MTIAMIDCVRPTMYRSERGVGSEQVTQARSGNGRWRTETLERGVVCIAADGKHGKKIQW